MYSLPTPPNVALDICTLPYSQMILFDQCFDGSPSFVTLDGSRTPFLMMDGGCSKYQGGTLPCMESLGNGSTGGVTAIPVDLSDKNLTKWNRR
eukprot:1218100-Amorphochlora_amoeboformis.AAC.1